MHLRPDYTSIVIMRGEHVIFFRNRPEGDETSIADLVHQTAMYYQDRLSGNGFARVFLGGSGRVMGPLNRRAAIWRNDLAHPSSPLIRRGPPRSPTAFP